jgi:adenine-specific DNA methylase
VNLVLAKSFDVVEQDRLDQLRVHDEDGMKAEIVVDNNRLFIEVAPQLPTGFETTRASSARKGSCPFGGFGASVMEETQFGRPARLVETPGLGR